MALGSAVAASADPLQAPGAGRVRAVLHSATLPELASRLMHALQFQAYDTHAAADGAKGQYSCSFAYCSS